MAERSTDLLGVPRTSGSSLIEPASGSDRGAAPGQSGNDDFYASSPERGDLGQPRPRRHLRAEQSLFGFPTLASDSR